MSRARIAGIVVLGMLVALFGGRWLAVRYTEALWYADLGRSAQFRHLLASRLLWQGLTLVAATLWYGAQSFGVYRSIGAVHLPRRVGNLEIAEAVPRSVLRAIAAGIALLLGVVTVATFHDLSDYVALSQAATPLGATQGLLAGACAIQATATVGGAAIWCPITVIGGIASPNLTGVTITGPTGGASVATNAMICNTGTAITGGYTNMSIPYWVNTVIDPSYPKTY